jgi:pyruvate dehydrogenase phosphatase
VLFNSGRMIPPPYTPPYVGTQPDIFHLTLTPKDRFLILASDGLWDYLTDEEAVEIVSTHYKETPELVAQILIQRALEVAAMESEMSVQQLLSLPAGRERRRRHDDTTAVVLYF